MAQMVPCKGPQTSPVTIRFSDRYTAKGDSKESPLLRFDGIDNNM